MNLTQKLITLTIATVIYFISRAGITAVFAADVPSDAHTIAQAVLQGVFFIVIAVVISRKTKTAKTTRAGK